MHVAIYETNLMWSVRLQKGIEALGHSCEVVSIAALPKTTASLAILNLGTESFCQASHLTALREQGTVTVGHAGHKESALLDGGRQNGVDHVVTNSMLAHKLADILALGAAQTA